MKAASLCVSALMFAVGCGSSGTEEPANTGGVNAGGAGSGAGGVPSGGVATGGAGAGSPATGGAGAGSPATGGAGAGGAPTGGASGAGGATGGSGGAAGGAGGGTTTGFSCPAGAAEAPKLTGLTPTKVMGVPPADDFNQQNNQATNIEGAVWVGGALYVSEINYSNAQPNQPPPSRVLKVTADDKVSIAIMPDSGTNGLAINAAGDLFGAVHKDGSISKLSLSGGAAVPVVSKFMTLRFNSPNDLTFHTNGTLYFTDPDYQAPKPVPQAATRAYRVPVGGEPVEIEALNQPNGITLSKKQDFLYVAAASGIKKYPVMADGSLGAGTAFGQGGGVDGMVIDCADNLYATQNGVVVYSPAGQSLGSFTVPGLPQVTNVAFGGTDHKTLYITGMGNEKGLFKVAMNVAGYPY
jgi:gluconolactonase